MSAIDFKVNQKTSLHEDGCYLSQYNIHNKNMADYIVTRDKPAISSVEKKAYNQPSILFSDGYASLKDIETDTKLKYTELTSDPEKNQLTLPSDLKPAFLKLKNTPKETTLIHSELLYVDKADATDNMRKNPRYTNPTFWPLLRNDRQTAKHLIPEETGGTRFGAASRLDKTIYKRK